MLKLLSENNKLHAIRETVVVLSNKINSTKNRLEISCAEFSYIISRKKGHQFKVSYGLQFHFKPFRLPIFRSDARLFSFYIICEGLNRKKEEKFIDSISCIISSHSCSIEIEPVVSNTTTAGAGQDTSKEFAGLYKISIAIPHSISLRTPFDLIIEYELLTKIFSTESQYDFFILPSNYSKKIDRLDIAVEVHDIKISQLSFQEISYQNGVSYVRSFSNDPIHTEKYYIERGLTKPNMDSAYFVLLNYKESKK